MKKMLKRLCTGFLALATVVTALPTTPVYAESKQYWTDINVKTILNNCANIFMYNCSIIFIRYFG